MSVPDRVLGALLSDLGLERGHAVATAARPVGQDLRLRVAVLLVTIAVVAGCSGTATPTASTPNPQPTAASSAAPPSVVAPSLASPKLASPDGSAGDFKAYADSTLRPALNALSDAFNGWGEAFNAAARSGATDADKAAYAAAASRLKDTLAAAKTALDSAPTVGCAGEARASAATFLSLIKGGLDPLLSKSSIGLGDLAVAGALLQEAAKQAPGVAAAIKAACQ